MLPIGDDLFVTTIENSVFIDKSMLIADVVDSGYKATLFCRPRRFGKSLNLSMLQRFFEIPSPEDPAASNTAPLFEGLAIWDAEGGRYREHHGAYPLIHFSFNDTKKESWPDVLGALADKVAAEYARHGYLLQSDELLPVEKEAYGEIMAGRFGPGELGSSLLRLSRMLFKHHRKRVVVLVDEYDVPVMGGRTKGYYDEAVSFMKGWLTGAFKGNDALAFAVMTGVQRISKESIFSDLNNLVVNTALNLRSDERFGFTDEEVEALAEYLGRESSMEEVRRWYDGYRFGSVDIYNPWSVLNYFENHCMADVYWGNTSGNAVLGDMVGTADDRTLEKLYRLLENGGSVSEPLDTGVVFPDGATPEPVLWSMLYLAGYLTTDDIESPNNRSVSRALRIPNLEIAQLFRGEIVDRFARVAGGGERLEAFHRALAAGEGDKVTEELGSVLLQGPSYFDLTSENSYHMLMLGLLFGMAGYRDPLSNREAGRGRYDICLNPLDPDRLPVIVMELKVMRAQLGSSLADSLAEAALAQIEDRAYDCAANAGEAGIVRYALVFSGKDVAVATARRAAR